jgi:hypothetical protein
MAHVLVLSVVFVVALFDVGVGVILLVSRTPYLAHGARGLWAERTPALWSGETSVLLRSLYRRLGAFSFHTGAVTAVWAWTARDEPRLLTALLVTYTLTGLAFFATDRAFFRGTRYFVVKQALGAHWAAALVGHLSATW